MQWTLAYLAIGWGALQVLGYAADSFGLPTTVQRIGLIAYAAGVSVVLILAWYHGERGDQRVSKMELTLLAATLAASGFGVAGVWSPHHEREGSAPAGSETNSIAVLPFANRSNDPNNEYFSEGISEEILHQLARIPNLRVRPRSSAFAFKSQDIPTGQIAAKLRVRYILEGSVQRSGDQVRISASLVDAAQDQTVWSENFDRKVDDIFAIEDEISQAIAEKLRLRLTEKDAGPRTSNHEAHELYLRGRYLLAKSSEESIVQSWSFFERAIAIDSSYAAAYAALAEAYLLGAAERKTNEVFNKARVAAARALALDERQAQAHTVLGALLMWRDWNIGAAEREFMRALQIDPNSANTYDYLAWVRQLQGKPDEAVRLVERAVSIDPFSVWLSYALEFRYVNTRMYDRAIQQHKITESLDPHQFYWDLPVAIAYREKLQYDDAVREYQRVLQHLGHRPLHGLAITYARMGKVEQARAIAAQLERNARTGHVPPTQLAAVYANLGDIDRAFTWLDKAYRERDGWLGGWIQVDPSYDPLRNDARFHALSESIRRDMRF